MEEKKAEKKNIFESLTRVMGDIGAVAKDSVNEQQCFNYRGIDAVMNALNPALVKNKVFIASEVLEMTREERKTARGGIMICTVLQVKYTFYAEDGSHVSTVAPGEGMDSGDKSINKAMTSAFKNACFQMFCIPTEEAKDPDAETPEESFQAVITFEQGKELLAELLRTGVGQARILRNYKVEQIGELTEPQWEEAMKTLKGKPDRPDKKTT